MSPFPPSPTSRRPGLPGLAAALLLLLSVSRAGAAPPAPGDEAPAYDRQVNLVYTVNNLGYLDTCG